MDTEHDFIRWFSDLGLADLPLVGGKNASLGEMVRELGSQGLRVPDGFAITASAYKATLDAGGAWDALHAALDGLAGLYQYEKATLPYTSGRKARGLSQSGRLPCKGE